MIIYEVNLDVSPDIIGEFRTWLKQHFADMLTIEGFIRGDIFDREDDLPTDKIKLTTHYYLDSKQSLENYFKFHAEKMRADGAQKFGTKFTAYRRILMPNN